MSSTEHRAVSARSYPARAPRRVRAPIGGRQGFSLIEVLVALVVMSVGLLTVAALQVYSLRNGSVALNGTRATLLASDIVDRIRANPAGAQFYSLGLNEGAANPGVDCVDTVDNQINAPCTPQVMAEYDLWEWRRLMTADGSLPIPAGKGGVEFIPGNPQVHRITLEWREDNEARSYTLSIGR